VKNHAAYSHIVNSHEEDIDKNVVKSIRDYNLLKQAKDMMKQLQPIGDALDQLQGDKVSIADACEAWIELQSSTVLEPVLG